MSIHATLGATLYRAAVARIVEDCYIGAGAVNMARESWNGGRRVGVVQRRHVFGWSEGVYQTVRHRLVVGGTAGIMRNQVSKVGHEDRLGIARFLVVVFRLESKGPDWSKTTSRKH
ncbi:hypothetical protein GE21DRAFT_1999 [Neurospora crassa]|uniref:Uncharacterized protein n=1 Tax=Neurospora crassa (strain ATCC 24698 / 74-OR23-1A / CBS 708.71 / DSM 1257 / FGSC 987) TaxID=367110 RepID=A7UVW6_NEUCR|nr:hypothetical protein NCU10793 [Neurospora crassa OR74A]EDO65375.1 hypothetical protein NCU10793 [Neurospora crassa OR74A]KHE89734.1 hypothetical protein GE21DRAFT_1999 [Neurospora crassa]|eukprot:XP_001728466.1 hypothetical protein NCU10793 [Neurospora crassa OR74A]